ncbi:MAG: DNA primase [candidate division Zixibacteria bacterium]|nr:DNA primase [candidate division Zixibacteria bacterium]
MPDDALKEQVKEATDIVAVIGQFITLRKRGNNHIGLCPFHTEKTPSFNVHGDRGFFHCFGCGKGGDVFTFLMEHEGWTFPEALKYCADRAGIRLPERSHDDDAQGKRRQEVYDALALADEVYRRALFATSGKVALDYLKNRGFKEETLRRIGIGYAPPPFDTLTKTARARGLRTQPFLSAGLMLESKQGDQPYDRFRHRVTFPIHNLSGKVVGFGARTISPDDQPKYLNSPETEVYHKGRILYGLWTAREAIRKADRAFVVEGYLDWLTMVEFGVDNVVAVSGTAFTIDQAALLGRFCKRMTLIFDADSAGQRATLRGIDIAFNAGIGVDLAVLPAGDDPDTYLRREGRARFDELVAKAPGIIEYRVNMARSGSAPFDFLAKERLAKEFVELANKIQDQTRRTAFLSEVAERIGLPQGQLKVETPAIRPTAPVPRARQSAYDGSRQLQEAQLLRLIVEDRDCALTAKNELLSSDFMFRIHRPMFDSLIRSVDRGEVKASPTELGTSPEEVAEWARILVLPMDINAARAGFIKTVRSLIARRVRTRQGSDYKRQFDDGGIDAEARARLLGEHGQQLRSSFADNRKPKPSTSEPEEPDTAD